MSKETFTTVNHGPKKATLMKCAPNTKERKQNHPCADVNKAKGVTHELGLGEDDSDAKAAAETLWWSVPPCTASVLVLEEQRGQTPAGQVTPAEEKTLTVSQTEAAERARTTNTCTGLQDCQTVCYGDCWDYWDWMPWMWVRNLNPNPVVNLTPQSPSISHNQLAYDDLISDKVARKWSVASSLVKETLIC